MMKMPSDLGFSDERYKLPPLNISKHVVRNTSTMEDDGQLLLFAPTAKTMTEVKNMTETMRTMIETRNIAEVVKTTRKRIKTN